MSRKIKYLGMDVDGTLTDGKIYMGEHGEAMKAFSVKDGYAIQYILKPAEIIPVVLTARTSEIVQRRCTELGITEVYQGKKDKLTVLKQLAGADEIGFCAYFGDDVLDMECMKEIKTAGGITGCPADAVQEVRAIADYICVKKAGEGALREFSEWLVKKQNETNDNLEERIQSAVKYLQQITVNEASLGKYEVDSGFYYCIQRYQTKEEKNCRLESHRQYVDVQIMVQGQEAMDLADISRLEVQEEYDQVTDVLFWNLPKRMARTVLRQGDYIILYPENAHRGAIQINGAKDVVKIVGKVKI